MPTPVTITTAAVQYAQGTTECHCTIVADTVAGTTSVGRVVQIPSATLADDWTDDQLCAAVAEALGVQVEDVSPAPNGVTRIDTLEA